MKILKPKISRQDDATSELSPCDQEGGLATLGWYDHNNQGMIPAATNQCVKCAERNKYSYSKFILFGDNYLMMVHNLALAEIVKRWKTMIGK